MKRSRFGERSCVDPAEAAALIWLSPYGARSKTRRVRERLAIRNAPAFHDWRGIPRGEESRPCSHSLNSH